MTAFEFGSVVLVAFPFTDLATTKQRPAAVVSSRRYNVERPDLIILAITSRAGVQGGIGEAALDDWSTAGLLKPSLLKPVLTTIEQRLVRRPLGALSTRDCRALRRILDEIIG
ncbi:MAG TPA: type II toxin-antitoxin system PemK/MazF family toxin [Geminicoccaceae bacterium]|nr:type II toxin-antitoxin system PemK/MazF family toxin [Geminicoccaceae bacterium]